MQWWFNPAYILIDCIKWIYSLPCHIGQILMTKMFWDIFILTLKRNKKKMEESRCTLSSKLGEHKVLLHRSIYVLSNKVQATSRRRLSKGQREMSL